MQWNIEANPKKKEENAKVRYIQNVKHYNKLKYPITFSVIKYWNNVAKMRANARLSKQK